MTHVRPLLVRVEYTPNIIISYSDTMYYSFVSENLVTSRTPADEPAFTREILAKLS